jgi:adenylate kinase family enzyme
MDIDDERLEWSRIVVVGTSCSGKTTLARVLASRLDIPHVELDALHWLPGWQERPGAEFRDLVATRTAGPRWVVDGNYRKVTMELVWPRASLILWLDYPFALVFWRGLRRTLRRSITSEELFGGNRESLGRSLFSRGSILWWIVQTHRRRHRDYGALWAQGSHPMVALKRPVEAQRLLARLGRP